MVNKTSGNKPRKWCDLWVGIKREGEVALTKQVVRVIT